MRRNAAYLMACLALTVVLAGCSTTQKSDSYASDSSANMYEPAGGAEANDPYADDPYADTGSSGAYGSPAADPGYDSGGAARYHTVAKKDTLYSLARMYYSDQSRWKDIYEANSGTLSDPNRIFVGQRLVIP